MIEPSKTDNPKAVAEIFAKTYREKGYNLDFSIESLKIEIDLILEKESQKTSNDIEKLEAELTAYFGETLCRVFDAEWKGSYYGYKNPNGVNFYTCRIKKTSLKLDLVNFLSIISLMVKKILEVLTNI